MQKARVDSLDPVFGESRGMGAYWIDLKPLSNLLAKRLPSQLRLCYIRKSCIT